MIYFREMLIIPQAGGATAEAEMFAYMYAEEETWLDWALEYLGKPPLSALFIEQHAW